MVQFDQLQLVYIDRCCVNFSFNEMTCWLQMHPTSIHITAVLVNWTTPTGRPQKGVATSWLNLKRPAGEETPLVPVFVRKSQFRLPFKPTVPVIMIGPGTGVAPFRGFIQDRHIVKSEGNVCVIVICVCTKRWHPRKAVLLSQIFLNLIYD